MRPNIEELERSLDHERQMAQGFPMDGVARAALALIRAYKDELKQARREAFEEAAKIVGRKVSSMDGYEMGMRDALVAAIRARMEEKQ